MNLKDINDLTNKILSESTYKKDDFLNRWPYTAPYLEEKYSPDTKKVKNCGCGQNPCKTYGDRAEPVAEAKKGKELCESCKGEGCKDCDNTGYKMMSEGASHTGLEKVASKLEKASATHKKQAKKIRDHVEDMKEENLAEIAPALAGVLKMGAKAAGKAALRKGAMKVANKVTQNPSDDEEMSEELNPKLKAIDAKNKARVEAEGRAAAAERQKRRESADAYRKHKNEVMAKGGRPVDALDSWMRKKLGMEHVETVSKLIESNQFSEEELLKIIESM